MAEACYSWGPTTNKRYALCSAVFLSRPLPREPCPKFFGPDQGGAKNADPNSPNPEEIFVIGVKKQLVTSRRPLSDRF